MSQFSTYLRVLTETSGESIYSLAKKAGVDRTLLHKTISGDRLPAEGFLKKISRALMLTESKKNKLSTYYQIAKIGEDVYDQQCYIRHMIESLTSIPRPTTQIDRQFAFDPDFVKDPSVHIYKTKYETNNLIKTFLESVCFAGQATYLYLFVPPDFDFLYDLLYSGQLDSTINVEIKQLIALRPGKDHVLYNLKILDKLIWLALSPHDGYSSYYYYARGDLQNSVSLVMPYYIITDFGVVTLSADCTEAFLYCGLNVIRYYTNFFHDAMKRANPLSATYSSAAGILANYESIEKNMLSYAGIGFQPTFLDFVTKDLLEKKLRPVPNREALLSAAVRHFDQVSRLFLNTVSVFPEEGLDELIHTGYFTQLPSEALIPLTKEERLAYLLRLRECTEKELVHARVANPAKFSVSRTTWVSVFENLGVEIMLTDPAASIYRVVYLEETSIVDAFCSFSKDLLQQSLVYNKEETLKIIDKKIQFLQS